MDGDVGEQEGEEDGMRGVVKEIGGGGKDNGSGTEKGCGGLGFGIGETGKGGMYSEYPSLKEGDLLEGDLQFNIDYRGVYGSMIEDWLHLDPIPVVGGNFEQLDFVK